MLAKLKRTSYAIKSIDQAIDLGYIRENYKAAIKLAKNPEFHKRTKHIDIQYQGYLRVWFSPN
jgi:hypothetical protein